MCNIPVVNLKKTGLNILKLRERAGLSVRDLQEELQLDSPQAIYKWQSGQSLPTVDNLYALGVLLDVPMEEILVSSKPRLNMVISEQQAAVCCSNHLIGSFGYDSRPASRLPIPETAMIRSHFEILCA